MTLPAQSIPDASEPEHASPDGGARSPGPLIAVIAVSALVVILCVLGAAFSGLFTFASSDAPDEDPPPSAVVASNGPPPVTTFDDGQYLIQREVLPGTYETNVPSNSPGCIWERRSATDGTANSLIDRGSGKPGSKVAVDIKGTDKIFYSRGCGEWHRVADES